MTSCSAPLIIYACVAGLALLAVALVLHDLLSVAVARLLAFVLPIREVVLLGDVDRFEGNTERKRERVGSH